jgi:hypothetical protein
LLDVKDLRAMLQHVGEHVTGRCVPRANVRGAARREDPHARQ